MNNRFDELPAGIKSLLAFCGVFVAICGVLTIWAFTI